jgi:hypothetical protein
MIFRILNLFLFLALSAGAQTITSLIPFTRLPATGTFQGIAGVPGGIDQYSTNYTMFCNVRISIPGTTNIAYGDGIHDDTAAINFAVSAAPNGSYVYIPTGIYLLTAPIIKQAPNYYDGISRPFSLIIRGDGMGKTVLLNNAPGGEIIFLLNNSGWVNRGISSVNTRGTTNFTLAAGLPGTIPIGSWVLVSHDDTLANVYYPSVTDAHPYYYTYINASAQFVKITGENGSTVSFTPPLNEGYTNDVATFWGNPPYHCGIEDLTVVRLQDINAHNLRILGGQECWIKNVESRQARGYHISIEQCGGCEVRECYIHDPFPLQDGNTAGGGSDYGITLGFHSSSCLVEDNIALHCRHSFILETGAGQDNVIAYNYGKDNINEGLFSTDYQEDTMMHGGEPRYNLFEGNVFPILRFDTVEGATKYDVVFRNLITRDGIPTVTVAMNAMDVQRGNYYDYFLDNVYLPCLASPTTPAYRIGSWEDTWPYDPTVYTNNTWFENLDLSSSQIDRSTNGVILWTNSASYTFPSSLYCTTKPSWYSSNLTWPAFGQDVAGYTNLIPAQARAIALGINTTAIAQYTLTATNTTGGTVAASGNGSYFNTAWVGLVANPNASHVFSGWSGYPVSNPSATNTYFIMPSGNVTLTALFNPMSQGQIPIMHPPPNLHAQ